MVPPETKIVPCNSTGVGKSSIPKLRDCASGMGRVHATFDSSFCRTLYLQIVEPISNELTIPLCSYYGSLHPCESEMMKGRRSMQLIIIMGSSLPYLQLESRSRRPRVITVKHLWGATKSRCSRVLRRAIRRPPSQTSISSL